MLGGAASIHALVVIGLSNVVKADPTGASHQGSVHCAVQTHTGKRVVAVDEKEIQRLSLQQTEHFVPGRFAMRVTMDNLDFAKSDLEISYSLMNGSANAAIVDANFLPARQCTPKCKRTAAINADFKNVSWPGSN